MMSAIMGVMPVPRNNSKSDCLKHSSSSCSGGGGEATGVAADAAIAVKRFQILQVINQYSLHKLNVQIFSISKRCDVQEKIRLSSSTEARIPYLFFVAPRYIFCSISARVIYSP